MSNELSSRVAIITGASAGIGLAIAERLSAAGARVVVNARRADRLHALCDRLNTRSTTRGTPAATSVVGDAVDMGTIHEMFNAAERPAPGGFGQPADLVVVNAGRGLAGSLLSSDPAQWEDMIRTNVIGAARLMRTAAERLSALQTVGEGEAGQGGPWLKSPRDIVVIGSTVGRHLSPFSSMYGSTKFALHSLTEALRRELAPKGVRVSLIEPGIVESEFQSVAGYDPQNFGAFMRKIGPVLQPEDVARTVEFIVSQPSHVMVADVLVRPTRQEYP